MWTDKQIAAVVAAIGILITAAVAIWINGPYRRRIVDEIAMRNATTDPAATEMLDALIEKQVRRYAQRRTIKPVWLAIKIVLRLTQLAAQVTVIVLVIKVDLRSERNQILFLGGLLIGFVALMFEVFIGHLRRRDDEDEKPPETHDETAVSSRSKKRRSAV